MASSAGADVRVSQHLSLSSHSPPPTSIVALRMPTTTVLEHPADWFAVPAANDVHAPKDPVFAYRREGVS
ncbi:MAG: hypothetical protein WKH64_00915 [Chloroflexia bacterium]